MTTPSRLTGTWPSYAEEVYMDVLRKQALHSTVPMFKEEWPGIFVPTFHAELIHEARWKLVDKWRHDQVELRWGDC